MNGRTVDLSAVAAVAAPHAAPAAVVAAIRRGTREREGLGVAGRLRRDEGSAAASPRTLFDLASVTKPVTALLFARLVKRGLVQRDEALADLLPSLAATRSARTSLDLLSAHRAGLDGHRPLYAPLVEGRPVDREASLVVAADARREGCDGDPPLQGFPPVYSDLGYLLLGEALAARGGAPLDALVEAEVIAPLAALYGRDELRSIGSARQIRARDPGYVDRVAPTEVVPFRGGEVRGAVHDENAWALVGDASAGHAGLFGEAMGVALLGLAILDALAGDIPSFLGPEDMEPLVRDREGGSLLAGFDRKSGEAPMAGVRFGPRTFGHLGFTGTSLWMDPDQKLTGVLLTNRVHPTRAAIEIRAARPKVYDAIAEAMMEAGDG